MDESGGTDSPLDVNQSMRHHLFHIVFFCRLVVLWENLCSVVDTVHRAEGYIGPCDICPQLRPDSVQIIPPNQLQLQLHTLAYTQFTKHACAHVAGEA